MPIPASQIVSVTPRVIAAGGTDLEINGLLLVQNNIIPTSQMVLTFTSAKDVSAYFGAESDEYAAAQVYFKGYNNSFKKPSKFFIGRRIDAPAPAFLRGAAYKGTLQNLQAVKDGYMTISIDGTKAELTMLDFSSATSFSAIAAIIQTALTDAAVSYSSLTEAFTVTSKTTGAESSITYASAGVAGTDVSALLNLTPNAGAVISQGVETMSIAENMDVITGKSANWVTFTTSYEPESDELLALSTWASAQGVDYVYVPWTQAATALVQGSAADPASILKAANAGATAIIYGTLSHAAFILGSAASIDWNRTNGVIDFAFKSQDGLAVSVDDGADASALLAKGYNFYGNYATRNDEFVLLYNGQMFGQYGFLKPFINAVWLNNAMQVAVMSGLRASGDNPYTEESYTKVRGWLQDPINRATNNGAIRSGVALSESQKGELLTEAGLDISSELQTDGYYLQILDPGAQARVNGDSPVISLWYTDGGSVKRISISSTAIL